MIELGFFLYILLFLIFPIPVLVLTLGTGTTLSMYRIHQIWTHQPPEGKTILVFLFVCQSLNFFLSALVSFAMAFLVYWFIARFSYLFLFNLLFAFFISLRWFNFTQKWFKNRIDKMLAVPGKAQFDSAKGHFIIFLFKQKDIGFGSGLATVTLDAGYLLMTTQGPVFKGVMHQCNFSDQIFSEIRKVSSDKIRLLPCAPFPPFYPDACLIAFKDQFYPFRSREVRTRFLKVLQDPGNQEASPNP